MSNKPLVSKKMLRVVIPTIAVLIVLAIVMALYWEQIFGFFQNPEHIKDYVNSAGPWGPLVFIAVQFLQILVAPIPGQAVGVLAGALFGPWLGLVYSMAGAVLGFATVFVLAKLLGRPFVEKFVKKQDLDKFDKLTKKAGPLVLFLVFLLPGFPDDAICYIAGLSDLRIRTLVLISMAGRLPGYAITSFMGAGIGEANLKLVGILSIILVIAVGLIYIKRKPLKKWIDSLTNDDDAAQVN
jgi:uncharacterized membrane protein YdjX (TVP38/TMEM64 family)